MNRIKIKIINLALTLFFLFISVKYIKEPYIVYLLGELIGYIELGIYLIATEGDEYNCNEKKNNINKS